MQGVLTYKNSCNLGDEFQSIAAMQYVHHADALVDRDSGDLIWLSARKLGKIRVLYNGWFDGAYTKWPPPDHIDPIFIGFHINETDHSADPMYTNLEKTEKAEQMTTNAAYLKRYEPIGCRDLHTEKMLKSVGIRAYFSGCPVLTLRVHNIQKTGEILAIGINHPDVTAMYKMRVPDSIRSRAIDIKQICNTYELIEKMDLANALVRRIASASLVITSRLHSALVALANGVRVVFLNENMDDVRFTGYLPWLCALRPEDSSNVQWSHPYQKDIDHMAHQLRKDISQRMGVLDIHSILPRDSSSGVSIISVCMNRNVNLERVFPSWLSSGAREIVIVDWNSKPPIRDMIRKLEREHSRSSAHSPIVKIITITNVDTWVLTKSFNAAARVASSQWLLKLDADIKLDTDCIKEFESCEVHKMFYAGDWKCADDENGQKLNGVMYVARDDFLNVGGYNEYIETYGYDDCDLYGRLEKAGLSRMLIPLSKLAHIPHSNELRMSNQKLTRLYRLDVEIEMNRLLSELNMWPALPDTPWSEFALRKNASDEYVGEFISGVTLSRDLKQRLGEQAMVNRKCARQLYIQPKNGIGNRIRALCSALAIGRATGRDVVVIWLPDMHCMARWGDLFESIKDVVIIDFMPALSPNIYYHKFPCISVPSTRGSVDGYYNYELEQDAYIDDTMPCDIYIESSCVLNNKHSTWSLQDKILRSLVPIESIQRRIDSFSYENDIPDMIGVHIRMGQPANGAPFEDTTTYCDEARLGIEKWRSSSDWRVFVGEMEKILRKSKTQRFLICCDRPDTIRIMKYIFGKTIATYDREVYDRSIEQVQSGLIDMILLSRTKFILGSNWSSFTEIAFRMSGIVLKLAGVDF